MTPIHQQLLLSHASVCWLALIENAHGEVEFVRSVDLILHTI
jgi:hypothetical protein